MIGTSENAVFEAHSMTFLFLKKVILRSSDIQFYSRALIVVMSVEY